MGHGMGSSTIADGGSIIGVGMVRLRVYLQAI